LKKAWHASAGRRATFTTIHAGILKTGSVDYLLFDKIRIKREESEGMVGIDVDVGVDVDVVDVGWDKAGLDSSDMNLLL
jgi:hypothetical protein